MYSDPVPMRNVVLLAAMQLIMCGCEAEDAPRVVTGGDPEAGQLLIEQYGCGTCHVVPGVRTAFGQVGPSLETFGRNVYIAGELPNQPAILVRFIQDPQKLVPRTAMPDLGVNETHARDMSAYLYQLR
jgi:cytochrome c